MIERRKDTNLKGVTLPKEYLTIIESALNKNFKSELKSEKSNQEKFVVYGMLYPDEVVVLASLKNTANLRMTSCYASVDFPPKQAKTESSRKNAMNDSEAVQVCVGNCVDAIASFFATYFEEKRPIDYDEEYRQNWVSYDLEDKSQVFMKINRDNPELDAQADEILRQDEESQLIEKPTKSSKKSKATKKKTLH